MDMLTVFEGELQLLKIPVINGVLYFSYARTSLKLYTTGTYSIVLQSLAMWLVNVWSLNLIEPRQVDSIAAPG